MKGVLVIALGWLALSVPAAVGQDDAVVQDAVVQDDAVVQRGNEVYQYWCATCHGRGPGNPGTTALAAKYKGARPGVLEDRTDLTPQAISFVVRRGVSIMPFFRKTEVSDADLDAIAQYLTRTAGRAGDAPKP